MRLNHETVLVGNSCLLVPYRKEHVSKYHEWMKDPSMLEATGSEPLSIQEEYEMQESWRDDKEKCTFIVLSRDIVSDLEISSLPIPNAESCAPPSTLDRNFIGLTLPAMAGDVNLFLSEEEEEYDEDDDERPSSVALSQSASEAGTEAATQNYLQAELDIMVAEKECLRRGIGREACCMMMLYAAKHLSIRRFFCKINEDNASSLALFRKLGFKQCAYAACFKQYEFELKTESSEEMMSALASLLGRDTTASLFCPLDEDLSEKEAQ